MIETFLALLFAHVLADYVFQPGWMVARKRNPLVLLLHSALVLALSQAATGHVMAEPVVFLALAHGAIDAVKTWGFRDTLATHLVDQAAHLVVLAAIAAHAPNLWSTGSWADLSAWLPHLMVLASGALLATRAGGFAMEKLMAPLAESFTSDGLPRGGMLIGQLERGLIFLLILFGQTTSVGFLIAAKSIMRFEASKEQKAAEYVIIGTLASFGWAILAGQATVALFDLLPPLEITSGIP
ncbi:DUF3307 domain-containing protein [Roseovarius aestuariivivens]|uniref:DUF3307 domain-containing protein n=1 Tax=Roseovarius aestuariivivens TaxID=1888910 RepID=UPI00108005F4|nr:DUF3307 domain-containing protein [Roseovarius aestuariivivens]